LIPALSCYISQPFTSHKTDGKRYLQNIKSGDDFQLHFNANGITIGIYIDIDIDISNSLAGYANSN
jgi:hypothetical protein